MNYIAPFDFISLVETFIETFQSSLFPVDTTFCSPDLKLSTPIYSVFVSISVDMAVSPVFHFINSPDNSPLSHSVLPVLFLPCWSFQLHISL